MNFSMDLRYGLPPLIRVLFMFLLPHVRPWGLHYHDVHPFFGMILLFLISILVLLFLSVSTALPLTVKLAANTLRLQAGDFSALVTVSLICSVFLPPPLFWIAYPVVVCISPYFDSILNLLKCALHGFRCKLQTIPPVNIVFSLQQEHLADQEPPQIEIELVEIVIDP